MFLLQKTTKCTQSTLWETKGHYLKRVLLVLLSFLGTKMLKGINGKKKKLPKTCVLCVLHIIRCQKAKKQEKIGYSWERKLYIVKRVC